MDEEEYYDDADMQDMDDSFLNDEHPLYYELNPAELDHEDVEHEEAIMEYDETGHISRNTAQRLCHTQNLPPRGSGCMVMFALFIITLFSISIL